MTIQRKHEGVLLHISNVGERESPKDIAWHDKIPFLAS